MRKVRARLLKFNDLIDDDEKDDPKPPPPPVRPPPQPTSGTTAPKARKESKWGKISSNEPSLIPVQIEEPKVYAAKLSLEVEGSEDPLKLSEDKSVEYDEEHEGGEAMDEEEVDPLDAFMM
jgi:hypothetical protein